MILTAEDQNRYARQIALAGVGLQGQERLAQAKALVIGAGGLGSPAALYLAAAGTGTIGIADPDKVELSNLQRQIIHSSVFLGKPKVLSAAQALAGLNPRVNLAVYHEAVTEASLPDIIRDLDYDFVIDATDNFPAKFLINDVCVALKKPFSHGEVLGFKGQILTYIPGKGPCYRCVFGGPPPEDETPDSRGKAILGAVCGVTGSLQAAEALKYLLGFPCLAGALVSFDSLTMEFRTVRLKPNAACKTCGAG